MTARHWDRTTSVIALISIVVLFHVAVFAPFVADWTRHFPASRRVHLTFGSGVFSNGELLTVRNLPYQTTTTVCAIDLQRGTIRDLDLEIPSRSWGLVAQENRIWLVTADSVTEWDGSNKTVHAQKQLLNSPLGLVFAFEGCPAIVDLDDAGVKYRLRVFQNGKWHNRGEVGIPAARSTWEVNPVTGAKELRFAPKPGTAFRSPVQAIRVIETGGKHRVFAWDYSNWVLAYRDGLDLIDEQSDVASAGNPENDRAESSGWIDPGLKPGLFGIAVSKDRMVVATQHGQKEPILFLEKELDPSGQPFRVAGELNLNRWESLAMLYLPTTDEWYFIRDRDLAPRFYRYLDGVVREVPPLWENDLMRIIQWARPVVDISVGILLFGLVVLIAGAEWISRSQTDRYQFGTTSVRLAPIWQRCVARGIDLALIFIPLAFELSQLGSYRIGSDAIEVRDGFAPLQTATGQAVGRTIVWGFAISLVQIMTQGLWGVTLGKWLCGLRVRAATLRHCGVTGSLLREMFFLVDAPALLTVIPGIASMLRTDQRARLGDQLADTIVVMAYSTSDKGAVSTHDVQTESAAASIL